MSEYKKDKREFQGRLLQAVMAVAVFIAFLIFAEGIAAQAAESLSVEEINYYNSTITLRLDANDTKVFLSNATQKKWEYIPAVIETKNGSKIAVMDISWVSVSSNFVLSFKGDASTEAIKVTLPKQTSNLKVTYNMATSSLSFTNASESEIQWKKKEAMSWNDYDASSFSSQLSTFIDNGAMLVFRKKPVNGTSVENPGSRAGKEVSLSIAKKTAAPTIVLDDEKMTVTLKKGMTYRYVDENGEPLGTGEWETALDNDKEMALSVIAAQAMFDTMHSTAGSDVYIQFRKNATSSSQMSRNKTVKIPAQENMTAADLDTENNSIIEYTGASSLKLIFNTAGENNVLEYCVITANQASLGLTIDDITNNNLVWTMVDSSKAIVKTKDGEDKIAEGSKIYFRKKAVKTLGEEGYKIASPAYLLGEVRYPKGAITDSFTVLQSVEGTCKNGNNPLTFSFYSDSKGDINTIQFRTGGNATLKGTAEFKVNITETGLEDSKKYCYNVTLTDLSDISATRTMLYAYIFFNNESSKDPTTASIRSSEENGGIGLYIYPKTKIDNPKTNEKKEEVARKLKEAGYTGWNGYDAEDDRIGFTTEIERVYLSNRDEEALAAGELESADMLDGTDFRVKLDIGTLYVPDLSAGESEAFTEDKVEITKLKYDSVEISDPRYFKAEYYEDKDSSDKAIRVAVLTIYADEIEKIAQIDDRDKNTPVYIYLSNGEIITTGLTMNFQKTATAKPATFTMTAGNLEAWITTKTTEANGSVTETRTRNLDAYYKITLNRPSKLGGKSDYSVGVKSVCWDGNNILYSSENTGTSTITITLDSDLLNQITGITTSVTHDIRIEFTNGYVISGGIPLTINPGSGN